ncbi:MAG: MBL fold metallo-hydrolase, partial [bacterium]
MRTLRVEAPPGSHMDHVNVILAGEGPFVLIDAGYPEGAGEVIAWCEKTAGDRIEALLLTHHHHDHLGGAEAIARATGAASYAHPAEIALMKERAPTLSLTPLEGGDIFRAGGIALEAILTPGHSPGHLSFWWSE